MQISINYKENVIPVEVIFRKRKTIAIRVEAPDKVTIIAPERTRKSVIMNSVQSKAGWITKKLAELKERQDQISPKSYADGELFMYLGRKIPLHLHLDRTLQQPEVTLDHGKLSVNAPDIEPEIIKQALELWYRGQARSIIIAQVDHFQPLIPQSPNRVVIKTQNSRWGSCSSKANLNFNWKIIMAPLAVLDYVVVHEMCHLIYLNHSRDYWNLVGSILPDYKERKDWLRKNGCTLSC